ncbi:DUF4230 domain-containing protein [Aegicerativicinus sediminis]|uniref:DUF4230 domain-containing protein n=1 Tax=Aegicerativicinus sediminis TaxID=2893202 RepID=UPI001E2E0A25|nr:DUF4230 domain-containing protein [Aegicerativicinus sediminis]
MKKFLFGVILTLLVVVLYKSCTDKSREKMFLKESSSLIQEQIVNVGKLVVTEGHFSEVFTYKNSKSLFADLINVEKKALVVVNADVAVSYDLSKIDYDIDETNKTLRIISIPKEEITINPDFEYYDVTADYLNPFDAEDYNAIKDKVKANLMKKILQSEIKTNAENRLISELAKFFILTNSLGWRLEYQEYPIENIKELNQIDL